MTPEDRVYIIRLLNNQIKHLASREKTQWEWPIRDAKEEIKICRKIRDELSQKKQAQVKNPNKIKIENLDIIGTVPKAKTKEEAHFKFKKYILDYLRDVDMADWKTQKGSPTMFSVDGKRWSVRINLEKK